MLCHTFPTRSKRSVSLLANFFSLKLLCPSAILLFLFLFFFCFIYLFYYFILYFFKK
jgi:hypothetical protein